MPKWQFELNQLLGVSQFPSFACLKYIDGVLTKSNCIDEATIHVHIHVLLHSTCIKHVQHIYVQVPTQCNICSMKSTGIT